MTTRNFLDLADAGPDAIAVMLAEAQARKAARVGKPRGAADPDVPLAGRVLAMIFEKNSTRTRVSFDMAMRQLGGSTLILDAGTTQLGRGESVADTARVLGRMVDAVMIRTDDHAKLIEMATHAGVPVVNGPDRLEPSLPDHGRHADRDRAAWQPRGIALDLARRRQQCAALDHRGGRADGLRDDRLLARGL